MFAADAGVCANFAANPVVTPAASNLTGRRREFSTGAAAKRQSQPKPGIAVANISHNQIWSDWPASLPQAHTVLIR